MQGDTKEGCKPTGDIVSQMAAGSVEILTDATEENIRKHLGLDAPNYVQYGRWLGMIRDHHGSFSGLFSRQPWIIPMVPDTSH